MKCYNAEKTVQSGANEDERNRATHTTREPGRLQKLNGFVLVMAFAVLVSIFCGQVLAQAGIDMGSVTGTVKDPTGAVVQKAQCTLTNVDTGVSQKAVSTSVGAYAFSLVPVGTYSLNVTAPGFKDSVLTGIVVHVGNTDTEDVALQVGAADEQVTVTSAVPLLQAQDASLGMTVTSEMANELPITGAVGGRSFLSLLSIAPGSQPVNNQLIHGVASTQLDVRLNGADNNNEVVGGQIIAPIPDTIQEFKVQDGNNSAEIGEFYGPVVNVVTKQGTNKFQGEAWGYNENEIYNANDYFNKLHQLVTNASHSPNRPSKFRENSFGAIFGGPVILPGYNGHNKTFFTADFQYTYYFDEPNFTGTVPTPAMQSSGFTNLSDVLRQDYQTDPTKVRTSEKQDALGRWFQNGMMLDPATTRAIPCTASSDPITGLPVDCTKGYAVTDPNVNGGVKSAIIRDPFLTGAGGCPSLAGTMEFNSTYNQGTFAPSCFNQLPAGRLDPNALALLKLFPAANQQNSSNLTYSSNFYEVYPDPVNTKQYDVRVDHAFNDKDSAFVTWSHWNQWATPNPIFPGVLEGGGNTRFWTVNPTYMVVLTETHVFNPNLINQFRASDSHNWTTRFDPGSINSTMGIPAQYGIQGIPQLPGNGGLPVFNINSFISPFGSRVNIVSHQKVGAFTFSDDLTRIVGKHQWKFGAEYNWTYGDLSQLPTSRGSFTYNGMYSNVPNGNGNGAMADFLLLPGKNVGSSTYAAAGGLSTSTNQIGGASSYSGQIGSIMAYHAPYIAFYAVDSWKITPNVTATVGMREEYYGAYAAGGGHEANFWMGGTGNETAGSALYIAHDGCASARSAFFNGLLASDNIPIICEPGNTANQMPKANWAPRLGLAYRIRPNLVARLGGGVAYGAFGSVGGAGTLGTNYPWLLSINSGGSNNPYTPQLIGNGATTATMENTFGIYSMTDPLQASLPLGGVNLFGKQYHYHVPHVVTLNFALQWQFTNHDSIQATYIGNLGKDLDSANPYHNAPRQALPPSVAAKSSCTASQLAVNPYCMNSPAMLDGSGTTIPFPNLGSNAGPMDNTEQVSNYESGELEYQHQFAGGFSMDANYAFTSCLSDGQAGQQNESGPGNGRAPWIHGFGGYRADYDRCSNTSTHVFKVFGEYSLPVGKGAHWAAHAKAWEDAIIGGWKLDPIWVSASGVLSNVGCQGTNGQGPNPNFTGPWFQTGGTAWGCNAPTVPGQPLYGPGSKDLKRTRITGYWNSSAWTAPQSAVSSIGSMDFTPFGVRGNQIYGPGWYNFDLSTHKYFKTSEATKLEVLAEGFNVFNHPELNNPGTGSYTSPSGESITGGWGTITGSRHNPRNWEFAAKFFF
jgi:hypothetical protein